MKLRFSSAGLRRGLNEGLRRLRHWSKAHPHVSQLLIAICNYRGLRETVLRRYFFDMATYFGFSSLLSVKSNGAQYLVSTGDQVIGRDTFATGNYEQGLMASALKIIAGQQGKNVLQDRIFVDVGANIGTSTIPAVLHFGAGCAIAIEPDPTNTKLLRSNVILNGLESRVQVIHSALSDQAGMARLYRSSFNYGDHTLSSRYCRPATSLSNREAVTVTMRTMDQVLREMECNIDTVGLVWIDTQGHEGHVLAGATSILQSDVPVVLEYSPTALRQHDGLQLLHKDRKSVV